MKEPLRLKTTKPLSLAELLWMCKYFEIKNVSEGNIITFSGKVTMTGDCRMAYGTIINDKESRGNKQR